MMGIINTAENTSKSKYLSSNTQNLKL